MTITICVSEEKHPGGIYTYFAWPSNVPNMPGEGPFRERAKAIQQGRVCALLALKTVPDEIHFETVDHGPCFHFPTRTPQ